MLSFEENGDGQMFYFDFSSKGLPLPGKETPRRSLTQQCQNLALYQIHSNNFLKTDSQAEL